MIEYRGLIVQLRWHRISKPKPQVDIRLVHDKKALCFEHHRIELVFDVGHDLMYDASVKFAITGGEGMNLFGFSPLFSNDSTS